MSLTATACAVPASSSSTSANAAPRGTRAAVASTKPPSAPTASPTRDHAQHNMAVMPSAFPTTAIVASAVPRLAAPRTAEIPDGVLLIYHREGGIAGFCEELRIESADVAVSLSCKTGKLIELGRRKLSDSESRVLQTALERLKPFAFSRRDKAVADGMAVSITLGGRGSADATLIEQNALISFAEDMLKTTFDSES